MQVGECRLCRNEAELQLSHVIPAFMFRWLRDTSANGYLRNGVEPNKRMQDGVKYHWLCRKCEERIGQSEDLFARHIFHPFVSGERTRVRYGPWLCRFGASVVWRILHLYRTDGLRGYSEEQKRDVEAAEQAWRQFLSGKASNPGKFEVHALHTDGMAAASNVDFWPPTINRYLMRTIDTDVAASEGTCFIYGKLPRFIFLGFVRLDRPKDWIGTKVHATEGLIEPGEHVMPASFASYLVDKMKRTDEVMAKVSDRQQQRIDETFVANARDLVGTDLVLAMQRDIQLFGDAAFFENRRPGKSEQSTGS